MRELFVVVPLVGLIFLLLLMLWGTFNQKISLV